MRVVATLRDCVWRPLTDSDADAGFVVALRNDPRFRSQFYSSSPITLETHRQFIRAADERGEINWLIERGGRACGVSAIYHFDAANRKAEAGRIVMLDPRVFHLNWVISAHVAFDVIGLNKLYIETLKDNETLAGGVERLGMTREGLLREHIIRDGRALDVQFFGGTARDWDQIRAARFARFGTPTVLSFDGKKLTP